MSGSAGVSTKYLLSTVTASPDDKGLPSCVISTINADRDKDHVIPEGMDASNFMKAPVLMWSHGGSDRYASLPIGTVTSLNVTPGQGITASWRWLENDPMADRVRNAWEQGVVRGTSIGFRPTKMEPNTEGGVDHLAWELLELSVCPIPANPEAVRTLKALGLMDEKAIELGDNDKRSRIEAAIDEKFGPSDPQSGMYLYVLDVFDAYVIFRDKDGKHQRIDYAIDAAGIVSLSGDPIEVAVQYVPLSDEGKALLAAVQKRGRVLSAVNESRLRAAMEALANAGGVLTEVLAQLMPMKPDDMDEDEDEHDAMPDDDMDPKKPHKPKPMMPMMALDDAATYSLRLEDEPSGFRLLLAEDDMGAPVLTIVDDTGHEPTFSIDPAVMRSAIAETVREQLQTALVGPIW